MVCKGERPQGSKLALKTLFQTTLPSAPLHSFNLVIQLTKKPRLTWNTLIWCTFRYEIYLDEVKPGDLSVNFLREFMELPLTYFAPGAAMKFRKWLLFNNSFSLSPSCCLSLKTWVTMLESLVTYMHECFPHSRKYTFFDQSNAVIIFARVLLKSTKC